MVIRKATGDDVAAMAGLMTELGYPTTPSDMQTRFAAIAGKPDYAIWLAEYEGTVAGMIGLIHQWYFEKNGTYIRVAAMVTSEKFRNKGIGKLLMQKADEWAVATGSQQIILNSGLREERKVAYAFYQKLGFEIKTSGFVKTVI